MLRNTQNLLQNHSTRGEATQTLKMLWNKPSQIDNTPWGGDLRAPKNVWSSQQQPATGSTVDTKGSNRSTNSLLSRSRSCSQHFLSLRAKFDSQQQNVNHNIFEQQYFNSSQHHGNDNVFMQSQTQSQNQHRFMTVAQQDQQREQMMYEANGLKQRGERRSLSADQRPIESKSNSTVASTNDMTDSPMDTCADEMLTSAGTTTEEEEQTRQQTQRAGSILQSTPTKAQTDEVCMLSVSPSQFRITSDGYIWTPGNHKIPISEYLMQGDLQTQADADTRKCPAIAAQASYAQDMYTTWRANERLVDPNVFQLSFRSGTDIEKFRRMAIMFILQHVYDWGLSNATAHMSVNNIHRILLHYTKKDATHCGGYVNGTNANNGGVASSSGGAPKPLTTEIFVGCVLACLRMAIKHEERPNKARPMRSTPSSVCRLLGIDDPHLHIDSGFINTAEHDCLQIIAQPLAVSSAPEFLERYLLVGQWPRNLTLIYRDLAHYLLSLSFFSRRDLDQLAAIVPSLLAASALSLSIRVISAGSDHGYECWPRRLVVYTGYDANQLKPGVRGLSALLRHKPEGSKLLEKFHPRWANLDWK